jgi:hypothetical protein
MVKARKKEDDPPPGNIYTELQKEDKKLKRLESQIREATRKKQLSSNKKNKHKVVTKIVPGKMRNKQKRREMVVDMRKEKVRKKNLIRLKKKQIRLEKGEDA